jgi:hypothetical protein
MSMNYKKLSKKSMIHPMKQKMLGASNVATEIVNNSLQAAESPIKKKQLQEKCILRK